MKPSTVRQNTMTRIATRIDREIGRLDRLHSQMSRLKHAVRLEEQHSTKSGNGTQATENPFDILLS